MMRLLFVFCCLFTFPGFAQNITLKQLLKIRLQTPENINQKLTRSGWTFTADNKPDSSWMGKAVWAFNPVEPGNENAGAEAWCVLYYSPNTTSRILYNYFDGRALHKINKKLKRGNLVPLETGSQLKGIEGLKSYTDYGNNHYVMRVLTYQFPNRFGIKIFEKADYLSAKEKGFL